MDKQIIEERYKQLYRGMISKDEDLLSDVLAGEFCLIHMTGMKQSKEEFIEAVKSGVLNYYSAEHKSIESRIDGDDADIIGKSVVEAAVFGGGKNTWRLRLDLKLRKKEGVWLIIQAHASTF